MRDKVQDRPYRRNAVQGLRDAFHHKVLASGNQLVTNTSEDYLCMENSKPLKGEQTGGKYDRHSFSKNYQMTNLIK